MPLERIQRNGFSVPVVSGSKILLEEVTSIWVGDDDVVAFKGSIGFVRWQPVFIGRVREGDCRTLGEFSGVS